MPPNMTKLCKNCGPLTLSSAIGLLILNKAPYDCRGPCFTYNTHAFCVGILNWPCYCFQVVSGLSVKMEPANFLKAL